MIVRAPRPDGGFLILRNEVIRDERLSFRARGILAAILSRPDNWSTSAEQLAEEGPEGRDAILTALKELRTYGYLKTVRNRDDAGRIRTTSYVFDAPETDQPESENPTSVLTRGDALFPLVTPETGSPDPVNPTSIEDREKKTRKPIEPAPPPKRSLTPLPPDWQPTDKHRGEASNLALNLEAQAILFRNSALANDRRYKNWDAAFSNWLIRSVQYAGKPVKQEKPRSYLYGEA